MAGKAIKNSTVTREQYDKLQVDVVNRIEELEAKESYDSKQIRGQISRVTDRVYGRIEELEAKVERLSQANNNRHFEVRVVGVIALIGFATGIASLVSMVLV